MVLTNEELQAIKELNEILKKSLEKNSEAAKIDSSEDEPDPPVREIVRTDEDQGLETKGNKFK